MNKNTSVDGKVVFFTLDAMILDRDPTLNYCFSVILRGLQIL